MSMRRYISEQGQTMVMLVLGIIAFVAILALVLDGGNAYAAKRQAQNAADAGALAGATYMCKNVDEPNVIANTIDTANNYAKLNGADDPSEVDASLSNHTVIVTASVTKNTFFAGVIGFDQVSPHAVAKAGCRTPVGMGVLPVAWACRSTVVGGLNVPGDNCAQIKISDPICSGPYDLDCTYILMDSVKVKEKGKPCNPDANVGDPDYCYTQNDLVCSEHVRDPLTNKCTYVYPNTTDCDLNNDCIDELMTGGARSWLDLDGYGGGASELTEWIKNGFPDAIPPHKWIPEESGVATSIFHTAASYVVGEDVVLPVFNNICDGYPNIPVSTELGAACTYGPGDDRTIAGTNMNFHIITFSQFHVTCVQSAKNKLIAEPGYPDNKNCLGHEAAVTNGSIDDNDKTIEGYFEDVDIGGYGGPGDFFDAGAFTVILMPYP